MKLKIFVLIIIIVSNLKLKAQESTSIILEKAYVMAKEENKNIFIKYSASWCGWCKKMNNQMKSEICKPFFEDNYIIIDLIVKESENNKHLENPGALDLLIKHKGEKAGLPFWVILDNTGNMIKNSFDDNGKNIGCPATSWEVDSFLKILRNTSNISEKNLNKIAETFQAK